jgi:hypothetical protein
LISVCSLFDLCLVSDLHPDERIKHQIAVVCVAGALKKKPRTGAGSLGR